MLAPLGSLTLALLQAPRLGGFLAEICDLEGPTAAALAPSGEIYVLESFRQRVRVFDAERRPVREFGGPGSGPGQLCDPHALALDPDGDVLVADTMNHRVARFASSGAWRSSFGVRGQGPSEFNSPMGLAVDAQHIYVADTRNNRIQIFDRQGTWQRAFGTLGSGPGELRFPVDVAVDARGRLFVADQDNQRIVRTDAQGRFQLEWGVFGSFPGQLAVPSGVRIAGERAFVCDQGNHRIQVFDLDGHVDYEWGLHALRPHEGAGRLHYPSRIALDAGATRALVVEDFEDRCQLFGPASAQDAAALREQQQASTSAHYGGALDARGDLVVACEPGAPGFAVLDRTLGEPVDITRWAGYGLRAAAFVRPQGVALAPDATLLYVADPGAHRISAWRVERAPGTPLKYDPALARLSHEIDGQRLFELDPRREGRWPIEPIALECAADGELFALDAANQEVLALAPDLTPRRRIAHAGRRAGELVSAIDLAFDERTQRLFVLDQGAGRVQVFDRAGRPQQSFGAFGERAGAFVRPAGLACAPDGSLFVSDEGAQRILHFGADGSALATLGRAGLGRGQLYRPRGLCFDALGQLVVIDYGNHRGQTLTPEGGFVNAFGARLFTEPTRAAPHERD